MARAVWDENEKRKPNSGSFKKGHIPSLKGKQNLKIQGENHPNWRGGRAAYDSIHRWIKRHYGSATHCSEDPDHKAPFEWANISGEYKRDINDFKQLCRACHSVFDMKKNRQRRSALTEE